MNMKYLLACGVAAISIGTAMADPKPTVFPHGIAGASNVMTSAGAVQGTLSDTVTKAQGSVQQTDANKPNGYAKLDGSGNVTAPVTGSVAAAPANAAGDTVSSIADTAKSAQSLASGALPRSEIGLKNSAAPTDGNARMSAEVSGNLSPSIIYGQYQTAGVSLCPVSSSVKNPGGANWVVGDQITITDGSTAQVTSISTTGAVTGLSMVTGATHFTDPTGSLGWVPNPHTGASTDHVCVQVSAATGINPIPTQQYLTGAPTLRQYGATLDNSVADQTTITNIFNSLPSNSVVRVPADSNWNRDFSNPAGKNLTLLFEDGNKTPWGTPRGDNAVNIWHLAGETAAVKNETNSYINVPITALIENFSSNVPGPYSGEWNQSPALNLRAISGYTSTGNLSPASLTLNSFGQNPASAYDVTLPVNAKKYGQNSTWGIVVDIQDYSGKSPNAFSAWNEFDTQVNGPDIPSWAPNYGAPVEGGRVPVYISSVPMYYASMEWAAGKSISAHWDKTDLTHDLTVPSLLKVQSSDNINYVWYAVTSGTTGTTEPSFPVPARFVGTVSNNVLTVHSMASGSRAIAVGEYVTGADPVVPSQITSQISGTPGGVGTYQLDGNSNNFATQIALYSNPRVTDNTVQWQFGEEYDPTISAAIYVTGNATYDNVMAIDGTSSISAAALDTTMANMGSSAAAIRIGANQKIDLSGNGTLAGRNHHYLRYNSTTGALEYYGQTGSTLLLSISDSGDASFAGGAHLKGSLWLAQRSKSYLLSETNPTEGETAFDTDDHVQVTYRCPTTTTCGWFPVQYGAALSK